jgi:plasmid stability protein
MPRSPRKNHDDAPLRPITLRNLPEPVGRAVRERAVRYHVSLNQSVIQLLEESLGTAAPPEERVYHDLDELIGSWREQRARAAERSLAAQRRIDAEMWR